MDIVTLTIAKNNDDRSINLIDYGIDVPTLVLSGGGKTRNEDSAKGEAFVRDVQNIKPTFAIMNYGGIDFRCAVTCLKSTGGVCFSISLIYGDAMVSGNVEIDLIHDETGVITGTTTVAVVTQTNIPT